MRTSLKQHEQCIRNTNTYVSNIHTGVGVRPEDLEVNVVNGFLHIKADRQRVHRDDNLYQNKIERTHGTVERSIAIPSDALTDTVDTKFIHGVLTIRFPKRLGAATARKLTIHT